MYNFYHSIKQANTSVSAAGKPLRAMLPYIMTKQLVFLCSLANKWYIDHEFKSNT